MAHFVNSVARSALSVLTNNELVARLIEIETAGKKAKAAMDEGVGSHSVTIAVRAGRYVNVSAAEVTVNSLREAWKDIMTIIIERKETDMFPNP